MQVQLAYGREGVTVDLSPPIRPTLIRKPTMPLPVDPAAAVASALDSPSGCEPLPVLAAGARSACILVCDITRPVPNGAFLRPLIQRLMDAGVPRDGITVLVATGLHRPNLDDELAEVIGDPWVLAQVRVLNHDARDETVHRELGSTPTHGVPVALNRHLVDADLKIATGLVEPHFMAGYSGGRKVIAPGVAHHRTIRTFHSARFMEHPAATSCVLEDNPLHAAQLEIVAMLAGPVLALNTVIDEHRNLAFVSFGEIVTSHLEAVEFARRSCETGVGRRFHTVLTSSAGYPLDKTYYQTVKGMVTPLDILEPGGTLIIASRCSEGIGSEEFRDAQERLVALGPEAFLRSLEAKSLAEVDEWQTEMQLKPMRVGGVQLYAPDLAPVDHAVTGVERVDDLAAAVAAAVRRHDDPDVAVIPEGPYIVPFARAAA